MEIPEGTKTTTSEAQDVRAAVSEAAEALEIHTSQVDYKLDLDHFRSAAGSSLAKRTVKIIAWNSGRDVDEKPAKAPRKTEKREERRESSRSRDDRRPRDDRRSRDDRPAREERRPREDKRSGGRNNRSRREEESFSLDDLNAEDEAAVWSVNWIKELLKFLDLEGEVQGAGDEERVGLIVEIKENAGRFIGRRGMTLGAIRHLLHQSLSQTFGDRVVDVSIPDRRERPERPERSNSDRRDRKGRGGNRGSDRGGRSREGGSRISEEKLQALARRAADKAKESGQTITIKLELNSYDRRVVHLEISEIDGVETQSKEIEGEDGETMKVVQIVPSSDD